jgi:hypothetical protein
LRCILEKLSLVLCRLQCATAIHRGNKKGPKNEILNKISGRAALFFLRYSLQDGGIITSALLRIFRYLSEKKCANNKEKKQT